jgi:hypothetical protein
MTAVLIQRVKNGWVMVPFTQPANINMDEIMFFKGNTLNSFGEGGELLEAIKKMTMPAEAPPVITLPEVAKAVTEVREALDDPEPAPVEGRM